jgi:peroxiredoxin
VNKKVDLVLMGLVAILAVTLVYVVAGTLQPPIVNAGDSAPHFDITTDTGHRMTASSFGGKLLVLNFWASWCPPCVEETPSLEAFQRAYASKGVVVLGVSADRNDKLYRQFLDRFNVGFDTWRDPDGETGLPARYGTFQFPETYIIDSTGTVVYKIPDAQNFTDPNFIARIESKL